MKIKLVVSYVGTEYKGWQIQEIAKNSTHVGLEQVPTIQGEIEKALLALFDKEIRVVGASRTDSGVHAEGQVAHFVIDFEPKNVNWQRALNVNLPFDIRIVEAKQVDDSFHAQMDSIGKIYTYSLWADKSYVPPRMHPYTWPCGKVDFEKIQQALPYLIGRHDFASFQNVGTELHHTVRTINSISIEHISENESLFYFEGNGFLKQMIRNIMGLLVAVGKNKIPITRVGEIVEAKKRQDTILTAPAKALTLKKVLYEEI